MRHRRRNCGGLRPHRGAGTPQIPAGSVEVDVADGPRQRVSGSSRTADSASSEPGSVMRGTAIRRPRPDRTHDIPRLGTDEQSGRPRSPPRPTPSTLSSARPAPPGELITGTAETYGRLDGVADLVGPVLLKSAHPSKGMTGLARRSSVDAPAVRTGCRLRTARKRDQRVVHADDRTRCTPRATNPAEGRRQTVLPHRRDRVVRPVGRSLVSR